MNNPERKVTVIPAKPMAERQAMKRQLRVAAYCRVSTEEEEQQSSYEAQCSYYTDKIMTNPEWTMAGIFTDEGSFDIESEIIPFLSTLKGFKFGFNSGIRAEVLFINTKEVTVKWGTKNPINIPAPGLPAGMPIRAFGTFCCKISDHAALIEKIAGVKQQFTIDDVKERA